MQSVGHLYPHGGTWSYDGCRLATVALRHGIAYVFIPLTGYKLCLGGELLACGGTPPTRRGIVTRRGYFVGSGGRAPAVVADLVAVAGNVGADGLVSPPFAEKLLQ